MALPQVNGQLDTELNIVVPNDTGEWADLTDSWDDWTTWNFKPETTLLWLTDLLDLGETKTVNLKITCQANGIVEYDIYSSTTGAFDGEETVTSITSQQEDIPAITAQFIIVAVKVTQTRGLNTLEYVEIRANDARINILLNDVDLSTLAGTTSARTLVLPRKVSSIIAITVTPKELASPYTLDLYVSSTQTSTQLVPKIVSKTRTGPQIALTGLDNQPRDGHVDVSIWALPEMYMQGNDILTR